MTTPLHLDLGRYAAVIFDMDGVLLDSEPIHYIVSHEILADEGHRLDHETYQRYLGTTLQTFWNDLVEQLRLKRPSEHYQGEYVERLLRALENPIHPQPGVVALLAALKERGIPVAVASSATRRAVEASLRGIGLRDDFPVAISGDDVRRGKPDPEIYLKAAAELGVDPNRCLVIEDAPQGVRAGRAAGMEVLAVRTEHNAGYPFDDATFLVDSLADLAFVAAG